MPIGTENIFVHNIGYEILIQPSRIYKFLTRFFKILRKIFYRLRNFGIVPYRFEIVSAELLREKTVEGVKIEQKNDLLAVAEYIIGKN